MIKEQKDTLNKLTELRIKKENDSIMNILECMNIDSDKIPEVFECLKDNFVTDVLRNI